MAGGVSLSVGEGVGVKVTVLVVIVSPVGVVVVVDSVVVVPVGVFSTVAVLMLVDVSVLVGVLVAVSVTVVVMVPVAVGVEVMVIVEVPEGVFVIITLVISLVGVGVSLGYSFPRLGLPQRASIGTITKYRLPFSSVPSSSVVTVGLLAPTRTEPSSSACAPHLPFALSLISASTNSTRLVSGLTYEYQRTVFSPAPPLISSTASRSGFVVFLLMALLRLMVMPVNSLKAVKRVSSLCSCSGDKLSERSTPSMSPGVSNRRPASSLPVAYSLLITLVMSRHSLSD